MPSLHPFTFLMFFKSCLDIEFVMPNAFFHLDVEFVMSNAVLHLDIEFVMPNAVLHLDIEFVMPNAFFHLDIEFVMSNVLLHLDIEFVMSNAFLHLDIELSAIIGLSYTETKPRTYWVMPLKGRWSPPYPATEKWSSIVKPRLR